MQVVYFKSPVNMVLEGEGSPKILAEIKNSIH